MMPVTGKHQTALPRGSGGIKSLDRLAGLVYDLMAGPVAKMDMG